MTTTAVTLPTPTDTFQDRRRWAVLALMGLALCVVVLNNSALNVAIPAMMRDLEADLPTVQWIIDSYSIVFAGLLILAGACSDRWGRKRMTLAGLLVFGAASLLSAFSTEAWQLIALRGLLGAAAALVMPGTLAILLHAFSKQERAFAIAVWSGIAALGIALGPILGGLVVERAGWSAVFLLNVPLVGGVLIASAVLVRESADSHRRPVDVLGALLSVVAIGALVFAVIEFGAPDTPGWIVSASAALALLATAAVVLRLRSARYPLIELSLLRDRRFVGAAISNMLLFFGLAGSLFVLTQRLQFQLGMSPLTAGLAVGPIALTVAAASACAPRLARRIGPRYAVGAGMALATAGFLSLGWSGHDYPVIVLGLVAVGIGFGLAAPVATAVLVSAVSQDRASSGAALNDTMQEIGFALGIAVIGATLNRWYLAAAGEGGGSTLYEALTTAELLGGPAGAEIAEQAGAAFDRSGAVALTLAAVVTAAGTLIAVRLLPSAGRDRGA
ncbi:MFS transporter [Streptomyces sp. ACA25]|uniref:MFS transporter n=1 Tax=Streptomyces sp. ACA25 TaxID=3022596 RepID=UPI00230820D1|nr:MFS transporter [Streptomyces sp. ACA25]MDB1089335.1 MFS transporter [Streptomyces sp. ACA25]